MDGNLNQLQLDGNFNQLQLIDEVRKRPLLYSLEKTIDKEEKFAQWKEVGASMFPDWNTLNKAGIYDRVLQLQRKWRSLRDAYNRELRGRRSGNRVNRCVYRYFKPLSFLGGFDASMFDDTQVSDYSVVAPLFTKQETRNEANEEIIPEIQQDNNTVEVVEYSDPLVCAPPVKRQRRQKRKLKRPVSSEDESRNELEMPIYMEVNDVKDTDDSDKLFLLSFLPEMKQLPVNIKMWARAQIANVMQEAVSSQYNNTNPRGDFKSINQTVIKIQRNDSTEE